MAELEERVPEKGYEISFYENKKGQIDYVTALAENDGMGVFYEYNEDGSLDSAIMNSQSDNGEAMQQAKLIYEDDKTFVDYGCDGSIEYEVEGEFHPLGYPDTNNVV